MNQWTIPMLAVAGGWVWYISQHQQPEPANKGDEDSMDRPDSGSFTRANNYLWSRPGRIRAKKITPKQPELPGVAVGWFVTLLDGTLMEVHGSRAGIMRKVQLV